MPFSEEKITDSVVDGEVIMKGQHLLKINKREYIDAISEYPEDIGRRAAREFFDIHGTNAEFMEEDKL